MLSSLKISHRLTLGFGSLVVLVTLLGIFAVQEIHLLGEETQDLFLHPYTVGIAIRDVNVSVQLISRLLRHIVLVKEEQTTEKSLQEIDVEEKEALAKIEILKDRFLGDPRDIEEIRTEFLAWKPIRQEILSLFRAGKVEEAINVLNTKGNNHVAQMSKDIGDVVTFASKKAESFVAKAQKDSDAAEFWTAFTAISTGLLSFFLAYVIAQSINAPIALAVAAANKLAEGDISPNLEYHGSDEMADLLQAMKRMTSSIEKMTSAAETIASGDTTVQITLRSEKDILGKALNKMITSLNSFSGLALKISQGDLAVTAQPQSERDFLGKALADMTQNLKREITEIMGGINVLASAGAELSSSSTQMSSSFAETASSISETTTSLEEVKQTANLSSQRMKGVAESAQKSLGLAQAGKKASEDSIQAMIKIQDQMNSIADSIVKLSDQTQSIGEIIAAVDDIAEQSNLLAVNASIEAAKAGEEGKGFAVVAQEVKSLARQSKQATAQVRSILNEIQKATNAAVLVTEQGSKAVEVGSKQAQTAGEAIVSLAGVLNEASQSSIQVVSSSREQLIGIDQVLGAMENIKTASQQNFDSTRQLSKSAHELDGLGKKLKSMTGRYQI